MKTRTITISAVIGIFLKGFAYSAAFVPSGEITHNTNRPPVGTVIAWGNNYSKQSDVPRELRQVVAIGGGWVHSLAVKLDGSVVAWGYNGAGQTNVPGAALRNVVAVDGGTAHSIALKSDGTVVVWGVNLSGQRNVPAGVTNIIAIAAGAYHNVAVRANGTVVAWGDGQFSATSPPDGLSDVIAVAAGGFHNLGLKRDETVAAWGSNSDGESQVPRGLSNVVAIAAGWQHSLALKSDGTIVAWGRNFEGEIDVPAAATNIVAIAAGDYHSLALRADGKVFAWGYNDGDGDTVVPPGLTNVAAIACGGQHNLALVTNAVPVPNSIPFAQPQTVSVHEDASAMIRLRGFDADYDPLSYEVAHPEHGTLSGTPPNVLYRPASNYFGPDSFTFTVSDGEAESPPAKVSINVLAENVRPVGTVVAWGNTYSQQTDVPALLRDVVAIGGGSGHSLAVRFDGSVVAWGYNGGGQTSVPTGLRDVVAVDGGAAHSIALKADGTVVVWGVNLSGQRDVPANLTNIIAIAAGSHHSVVVRANGTVVAWGDRQFSATSPPAGLSNVVVVAAGGYHNLALKRDGTVVAWGSNSDGESQVPGGLSGVVAIAAGWKHSLALKSDGRIAAWGRNFEGEINVPPAATNIVAIAAGDYHSLALRADGKVFAWGYNDGDGDTLVPHGLTNVAAIACGGHHNLALVTNAAPVPNSIPFAQSQTISVHEDASVLIRLRGVDADDDPLSYEIGRRPAHGTLTGTPPNVLYRPASNYFGPDSFTFTVSDGEAESPPATISINVLPVNEGLIADASATPTRVIARHNDARVVLDGSRSQDGDGDSVQFLWFVDGSASPSATGRVAVVTLNVGSHDVLLRVDNGRVSDSDRVSVRVLTAEDAVEELVARVQAADLSGSLLVQLRLAKRAFARGNFALGAQHLEVFQQQLRGRRHEIDPAIFAALMEEAQFIIAGVSDAGRMQPRFTAYRCEQDGCVRMKFIGDAGRSYVIEVSDDLKNWVALGVAKEIVGGEFEMEEAAAGMPTRRFYRIATP